ncbi:MAG TPA: histidine kinase, partial [Acidimicrobiia bacterium]|nr:histidine kinase [Acidimicrobiia bacterium]
MRKRLRSLWNEPRAPNNPGTVWWDWWLVFAVVASAVIEGTVRDDVTWRPVAIAVAATLAFTLLWRRSHPLPVVAITFGVITAINVVTIINSDPSFGLYTMAFILLLPYALLRWGSEREIVVGLGVILIGYGTGIAADYTDFGEAVAGFVFAMSPAFIGAVVRYRSTARAGVREEMVLREREQLARELHDTVAHHVSAIAIRAQAGRTLAPTDPDAALDALLIIEEEASRTLVDMRTMVGALRRGEEPDLAPLPGIADISRLAGRVTDKPRIELSLSGPLDDITPAIDAAIYRLAQESITNAVRHARNATTVAVRVEADGRQVRLTVSDDGQTVRGAENAEPGFGLIGMRERA